MSGKNTIKTLLLLVLMAALFMVVGWVIGGTTGMLLALVAAAGTNVFAWWNSGKMVRRMQGAHVLERHQSPELFEMVEVLAARAEIPVPTLYLMESDQPNAFATGRNPENGAICITTGIVKALSADELAGVIAHEMAHIKSRDTLLMTVSATIAGAISMIAQFGLFFGGSRDRPMGGLGTILMAILAPMAAMVIQMTISRTREYAADRMGAEICRNPMWLASALIKISNSNTMLVTAERFPTTAHLFIHNPLTVRGTDSLFSTHPDIGNRVAELQELAREMGQKVIALPKVLPMPRLSPWGRRRGQSETGRAQTGTPAQSPWR